MRPRIAILDYGVGNLRSVQKGLEHQGADAFITDRIEELRESDAVVLPGVGAFADAMARLRPFEEELKDLATAKPLLGICLGMQLLFQESEEGGLHRGLGLLEGRVARLPPGLKIPHMGWNSLALARESPLLRGIRGGEEFYFVHSYYATPPQDAILATTEYGLEIPAVVARGRIFGVQFHPEKSGGAGLTILKNFVSLAAGSG